MGGQLINGHWQLPETALNALLGSSRQATNPYTTVQQPQYQPYQFQEFQGQAPNYDAILGQSLQTVMQDRDKLAARAVGSVDENMAARGLYRSGIRESAATEAASNVEMALRQLAQQQAQSLYGQGLNQYQSELSAHNARQQALAGQHNWSQEMASNAFAREQAAQREAEQFAYRMQQDEQDRLFREKELSQRMAIASMGNQPRQADRSEVLRDLTGLIQSKIMSIDVDRFARRPEMLMQEVNRVKQSIATDLQADLVTGLISQDEFHNLMKVVDLYAGSLMPQQPVTQPAPTNTSDNWLVRAIRGR